MKLRFFSFLLCFTALQIEAQVYCPNPPNSLPNPERKAGSPNPNIPTEHIIVLMQENHSFDQYFGKLNQTSFYGSEVDGLNSNMLNVDRENKSTSPFHASSLCTPDPDHEWTAMHEIWNHGKNDGFVRMSGTNAMSYYDETDINFYYKLANDFAIADRYFSSVLGPTYPNRFFLYSGTAFGHIDNSLPNPIVQFNQKTIFDVLNQYGISWKYYHNGPGFIHLYGPLNSHNAEKIKPIESYKQDLENGSLPQVVFIDSDNFRDEDEHPSANIQIGQKFVFFKLHDLVKSKYWANSAFFLTYDEAGGFFDHVSPPEACIPDNIDPILKPSDTLAQYDRLGFRVPFIAVSPFAKRHYVSHKVYDHTSILRFIETKFNLPALTYRDANAGDLLDLFDFSESNMEVEFSYPQQPASRFCH